MNLAEKHTITSRNTWSNYKRAWASLLANWKVLTVIYAVNLLIAFIGIGPLSNTVKKAIEKTAFHDSISQGFDYTLIMDILNNYELGINVSTTLLLSMGLPVVLWAIFCSGGITELVRLYPQQGLPGAFWQGGGKYFFRYLRLSLYVLTLIFGLLFILGSILLSDGLNPLAMVTEAPTVRMIFLLGITFAIALFFVGIFKELAKAKIAEDGKAIITLPNRAALFQTFKIKNILLGLLNLLVIGVALALYYFLRKLSGGSLIPAVLLGQLFLLFRIAHRFVKQASFYYGCEEG